MPKKDDTDNKMQGGSKDDSARFLLETDFENWTVSQMSDYFRSKTTDLGDYSELFEKHKIDGKIAHRLKDGDLKEMGIDSVGDRLRIIQEIEKIQQAQVQKNREKVVWEGKEKLYFNGFEKCVSTCCGCCPDDPSTFKLTGTHLVITTVNPLRCGPFPCCYGTKYEIDHVDLSTISDADVKGVPPSCWQACCCGATQEHVHVKTDSGETKILRLPMEEGSVVGRKILNQMEVAQRMERS
jgi:hypothetical protein